jgi:hypothetical protein
VRARTTIVALTAVAAASLAAVIAVAQKPGADVSEPYEIEVLATPLESFWKDAAPAPATPHLEWRGGLVLTSPSPSFGGWSGLLMDPNGKGFLALSDAGAWMTGKIAYDAGRPHSLTATRVGPLRDAEGKPLNSDQDRDSEAITLASGTLAKGTAYIGFERNSRIGLVDIDDAGVSPMTSMLEMPKEALDVGNDGIEAMLTLKSGPHAGELVTFLESPLAGETVHRGWIWISGEAKPFTIEGIGDYGITDAAGLDDGSVLLLERRFRPTDGVRIRLRRLPADAVAPGSVAKGEVLLEADGKQAEIDNLEALAVSKSEAGDTVLTIMSDDNFNHVLQRTLLLQFTLKDAPAAEASGAPSEGATKP